MIKILHKEVWAFDAEWVPDPVTGRAVYGLAAPLSDLEVIEEMWRQGGATPDEPRPYLKTVLCRVVSVSVVIRKADQGSPPKLTLFSLPRSEDGCLAEAELLKRFLSAVGGEKTPMGGVYFAVGGSQNLVLRALGTPPPSPPLLSKTDK